MSLDCGRNAESMERSQAGIGRTWNNVSNFIFLQMFVWSRSLTNKLGLIHFGSLSIRTCIQN